MMIKKKLLAIAAAAALSMTAMSAMADTLTLKSQNIPSPIQVTCNNKSGLPIPVNGQLGPLKYAFIQILFNGKSLNCSFAINGNTVGTAKLLIGPNSQRAQVISYNPSAGYSVTINPSDAVSQPAADMTVTLSKN